jgi:alpha-galactosidase
MNRAWRLDGAGRTVALVSRDDALPELIWFGAALPAGEDLIALAKAGRIDLTGGMLDELPPLSICARPATR